MALNLDQLITQFLSIRYPYPKGNCKIARNEVQAARMRLELRIRKEMREWPEETRKQFIDNLIENEKRAV